MRHPWVNVALLATLPVLLLTGLLGLMTGAAAGRWVLWLHAAGAYSLVLMLVWKGRVIVDVLRRGGRLTPTRVAFLLLTALTLAILATGLYWTTAGPASIGGFSLMTVHAVLALVVLFLLTWHTLARRWILRVAPARDRRAFLRLAVLLTGGGALWLAARTAKAALALPAAARRFTGSYETGSGTGVFPYTSWLFDNPAPVEVQAWALAVAGRVAHPLSLTYADLRSLPADAATVTLDCTGGWYSAQKWQGVRVGRLLELAGADVNAASVTVRSVTGYYRRFPLAEAAGFLLATHVAGQPLDHGHGAPVRLVAPEHRGFEWVKWVAAIEVSGVSPLLQPPLPLQ